MGVRWEFRQAGPDRRGGKQGGIRGCDGREENLRSVEVVEYRKWRRTENREIGRDLSGR